MHRRYDLVPFLLDSVIVLVLLLMVTVDAQARIALMSDRDWHWEIYVMDNDGDNQRNVTNNPGDDKYPSWSPDGKWIVFSSDRDNRGKNRQIYVMDADGGNPQNLTNNPHGDANPAWLNTPFSVSPAGKTFTMWGWLKKLDR